MIRPENINLIYNIITYAYSYYDAYLLFSIIMLYKSVSFIEFLMECWMWDEILVTTVNEDKTSLHLKSQLGQILDVH